jgi:hypothetical protein
MSSHRESRAAAGIRVGTVAAAATIGAMIGLGLRHGLALRPFMSTGVALLETIGVSANRGVMPVVVGVSLVAGAIIVLGVCFTVVAAPLRGVRLLAAAVAFGAIGWVAAAFVVPSILAPSGGPVLGTAQQVFVCALLSLGLVAGMRLARPSVRVE